MMSGAPGFGAALALLLAGGLSGCKKKTDEDLINAILDETIAAANEKAAGGVVEHASESFKGPRNANKRECRRILTGYFLGKGWVRAFEQSRNVVVSGQEADVTLDVIIAVGRDVKELEDLIPTNGTRLLFTVKMKKADAWQYVEATYKHVPP